MALVAILAACASKGEIKTVSDSVDEPFPAASYATFAFDHDTHQLADARPIRVETTNLLHASVAKALEAKGYREVSDKAEADFLVEYVVALEEWLDIGQVNANRGFTVSEANPTAYGAFGGSRWEPYAMTYDNARPDLTRPTAKLMREGSIAVHLLDPGDRHLLWGATSTKLLRRRDGERPAAAVQKVVDHTLSDLPGRE